MAKPQSWGPQCHGESRQVSQPSLHVEDGAAVQELKTIDKEWLPSPPLGIELSKEEIKAPPAVVRVKSLSIQYADSLKWEKQSSFPWL